LNDQFLDGFRRRRSADLLSAVGDVPLLRDERSVPTQDGVGGEERADLRQEFAAEVFAFDGEAAALVVGE
jgi:hypothetical protein